LLQNGSSTLQFISIFRPCPRNWTPHVIMDSNIFIHIFRCVDLQDLQMKHLPLTNNNLPIYLILPALLQLPEYSKFIPKNLSAADY
jgi:serine protease inhibitor